MKVGFEKWWDEQGRFLDPDTEDVPWYDKREALAHLAFDEGVKIGLARAGNYTANAAAAPSSIEFANGRTVRIKDMSSPDNAPYLEVGLAEHPKWAANTTSSQSLRDKIICLLIYPGAKDKSFGERADEILDAVRSHPDR